ncbi:MAG: two-component regulator propeller domain-containing protein [Bacteroidales bacterium]|nr:two-component regulator propeller domain-containing protein [Bacteroidales bacterium]
MTCKSPSWLKTIIRYPGLMIIVLLLNKLPVWPQEYYFDSYGVSEGLSSSKVYTIIQDRSDYLWLGTESGVTRWNGSEFENFSGNDGLATGGVMSLLEDHRGRIWMGHLNGGLSCYENNVFRRVRIDTLRISGDISGLAELDNKLWISTALNGAFCAEMPDTGSAFLSVRQYRGAEGLSDQVFDIYAGNDGDIYCISDVGIKKYNPGNDNFVTYRPEGLTTFFSTITMLEDSRGGRWFGTNKGGLYYFPPGDGKLVVYDVRDGLAGNWISCISENSAGQIWVGTWGGGITVFDDDGLHVFNESNGLQATQIHSIMEDHEGNMLISSQNNGIHVFKGYHFINYRPGNMFRDPAVWALAEDKYSRYWFGTNGGITLFDPEIGMPLFYYEGTHNISNQVRYIINDGDKNLWVGTANNGVYSYDFDQNDFTYDYELNSMLPFNNPGVTALAVDHDNKLWIGTNDGVGVWDIPGERGRRYTQGDGLAGNTITALHVDNEGRVWIGSEKRNGLTKYNPDKEEFTIIDLSNDYAPTCIGDTRDGMVWIGTRSGVFGLRADTLAIHLTENDGLLSNNINLLQPDKKGVLYIGTNKGLNSLDIETGIINTYTGENGFVGIETKQNASCIDSKGHLWFGTASGASRLAPEDLPPPDQEPLTHIRGMTVNFKERELIPGMRLRYTEKNIAFDYYSVCLTNPKAVRYRVMLEGADPDWRPETEQTTAIYSSLSPGKYTFRVKAQNSDGIWNAEPVSYDLLIRSPFYANPLFIGSVLMIFAVAILIYIRQREKNLVREKRILEEKVEERTAELVQKSRVIEEKNRDITASIRYAERIQLAMLPPEDSFNETFVLFLPKDIVSGDFYWMHDNGDIQFMAAVDCTGHGVPGAFMSIIGHNSLTKIVREYGILRPAAILDQLNIEVERSLIQRGDEVINDGMDLALIAYDKRNKRLEYAGAYNPLLIARNGEVITIKGDRFPIGMSTAHNKKFTNVDVDIRPGDMLYIFSDGYADQFGGPEGKKFKVGNLKNEFLKISSLPVADQKTSLLKTLGEWMRGKSQIDDILVIGTRVP